MAISKKIIKSTTQEILSHIASPKAKPKTDQLNALCSLLLESKNVLLHQAAGWGKSAVYWTGAKILADSSNRMTLVVSPLKPLMNDQMLAATSTGLRAALLNGTTEPEWVNTYQQCAAGMYDILFVTPEHLLRPDFIEQVLEKLRDKLGLLVIDEAHTISTWGHDFRLDYQRITEITAKFPSVPVLATTATADDATCLDIAEQLSGETVVIRGNLELPSLHLAVINDMSSDHRIGFTKNFIKQRGGSGLVFARTIENIKSINTGLRYSGINSKEYHAELDDDERIELEKAWLDGEIPVLVTSTAFSMGMNKQDASWVVHLNSPISLKSLYQEVGRVGRGGNEALSVVIPDSKTDGRALQTFPGKNLPNAIELQSALTYVNESMYPLTAYKLAELMRNGIKRATLLLKALAKDEAIYQAGNGWRPTGTVWTFDQASYDRQLAALRQDADLMKEYLNTEQCLMTFMRIGIGEHVPTDEKCGRCSNCKGHLPVGLNEYQKRVK
ncbi:MAG: RecQ family ATP-dependent DNA helicase [Actinobacteria bacterium]|nr:RecQ family ATP-dependent DNA helicase [Actinomycetota bacterium]